MEPEENLFFPCGVAGTRLCTCQCSTDAVPRQGCILQELVCACSGEVLEVLHAGKGMEGGKVEKSRYSAARIALHPLPLSAAVGSWVLLLLSGSDGKNDDNRWRWKILKPKSQFPPY